MASPQRDDMRSLLKNFGIQADERVIAHMARNPEVQRLHIRLVLQDLTDYAGAAPNTSLALEIEGEIERGQ